jgi:hypothetical protein
MGRSLRRGRSPSQFDRLAIALLFALFPEGHRCRTENTAPFLHDSRQWPLLIGSLAGACTHDSIGPLRALPNTASTGRRETEKEREMAREQGGQFGQGNPKQGGGNPSQRRPEPPQQGGQSRERQNEEREHQRRDQTEEEEEEEN